VTNNFIRFIFLRFVPLVPVNVVLKALSVIGEPKAEVSRFTKFSANFFVTAPE